MTDEERQKLCGDLRQVYRYIANDEINNIIWRAADEIEWLAFKNRLLRDIDDTFTQSDAEPKETWNKQPPGPDSIVHELGDCPTQSQPAQSDAEPVAWRWRYRSEPNDWRFTVNKFGPGPQQIMEPLYTAPPRPAASAGLIEAAEWLEANQTKFGAFWSYCVLLCAKDLRARAADRSGK